MEFGCRIFGLTAKTRAPTESANPSRKHPAWVRQPGPRLAAPAGKLSINQNISQNISQNINQRISQSLRERLKLDQIDRRADRPALTLWHATRMVDAVRLRGAGHAG